MQFSQAAFQAYFIRRSTVCWSHVGLPHVRGAFEALVPRADKVSR